MLKIGMVGSESTHAQTFSGLANFPSADGTDRFRARVTTIWGTDPVRTKQVADEKKIPRIVEKPEDMMGSVDAVMVVPRSGGQHRRCAEPFLKAGVPVWVDKPFTCDYADAAALAAAAKAGGALLCGGSICKFCCDAVMLQQLFRQMRAAGQFRSAALNFSGDINCQYDGIYFYGSHAVELLLFIFGGDILSVKTDVQANSLVALAKYPDFTVTVNFANTPQSCCLLYAGTGIAVRPIDITFAYEDALRAFVNMASGTRPPQDVKELLRSVRVLNALTESMKSGGSETPVKPV